MQPRFFEIYEDIQKKIQQEILSSGQKVSETLLMKEYQCSRATIRTIISWCDINGIFEVVPKSGTYVKEVTTQNFIEKVQVRAYLEKLACRLLIEKQPPADQTDLTGLYQLVEQMSLILAEIPYKLQEFSEKHYQFHLQLIVFAQNKHLHKSFLNLNLRYSYLFAEGADTDVRILLRSNKEHLAILDQITARNYEGCSKLIDEHLWDHKSIPPSLRNRSAKQL